MSELVILGLPPSSYVRTAMMICAIKGVDYRLQPVDFRKAEYRAHHPFGKMPVLQHGEKSIYETLAIGTYVDDVFGGPALQPETALGRAQMLQWISICNDYIYKEIIGHCVNEHFIKPMRGMEPDLELIAAAMPRITEQLDLLNTALNDRRFLCGDFVSLADCFLAPVLHYFAATPEGMKLLPGRGHITQWQVEMAKTAHFAQINALPG